MSAKDHIDTVRLTPAQRSALLDKLERAAAEAGSAPNVRKHERLPYRVGRLSVVFEHPGGADAHCVVASRNLSASGIGFVHGGFVYTGTVCRVTLPTIHGETRTLSGIVTACRHLAGKLHEVGVKFEREIDPFGDRFIDPDEPAPFDESAAIDLSQLEASVLLVDADEAAAVLLEHQLKETKLRLKVVDSLESAAELLQEEGFDMTLVSDGALRYDDGPEGPDALRAKGYEGPVVALTADGDEAYLARLREAGYADVIVKPCDVDDVLTTIARRLRRLGPADAGGAIRSTLAAGDGIEHLLTRYVEQVRKAVSTMRAALDGGDFVALRRAALAVKGSGAGYGFHKLSEIAGELVEALDAKVAADELALVMDRLEALTGRLRPETKLAQPEPEPGDEAPGDASASDADEGSPEADDAEGGAEDDAGEPAPEAGASADESDPPERAEAA